MTQTKWSSAAAAGWRTTVRVARYLGPLVRDTLVYLFKLLQEVVAGLRLLWWRWQARRNPATAQGLEQRVAVLGEHRASRWAPWRALPARRQVEVAASAVVLVLLAVTAARLWWRAREPTAPSSTLVNDVETPAPANTEAETSSADAAAEARKAVDEARKAVESFGAQRERTKSGEWAVLSESAVLEPGPVGSWDDFAVASPVIVKDENSGGGYRLWYLGCHVAAEEHSCGIGHAASRDGVGWQKTPRPVFAPADPVVQKGMYVLSGVYARGRYLLWYSLASDWFNGRRRPTVSLVTSSDGLTWTDEGQVLEDASEATMLIEHATFYDGERFHLWYVGREDGESSPLLQHLTSPDGKAWTLVGGTSLWTLKMYMDPFGRPWVTADGNKGYRALFSLGGQDSRGVLGALASDDGTTWTLRTIGVDPLIVFPDRNLLVQALTGLVERGGLSLWMTLMPQAGDARIGAAFRKGDWPWNSPVAPSSPSPRLVP